MLDVTHGHLQDCPCGAGKPCQGWYAPPAVYYTTCASCGVWIEGDTELQTTLHWNRDALRRGAANG